MADRECKSGAGRDFTAICIERAKEALNAALPESHRGSIIRPSLARFESIVREALEPLDSRHHIEPPRGSEPSLNPAAVLAQIVNKHPQTASENFISAAILFFMRDGDLYTFYRSMLYVNEFGIPKDLVLDQAGSHSLLERISNLRTLLNTIGLSAEVSFLDCLRACNNSTSPDDKLDLTRIETLAADTLAWTAPIGSKVARETVYRQTTCHARFHEEFPGWESARRKTETVISILQCLEPQAISEEAWKNCATIACAFSNTCGSNPELQNLNQEQIHRISSCCFGLAKTLPEFEVDIMFHDGFSLKRLLSALNLDGTLNLMEILLEHSMAGQGGILSNLDLLISNSTPGELRYLAAEIARLPDRLREICSGAPVQNTPLDCLSTQLLCNLHGEDICDLTVDRFPDTWKHKHNLRRPAELVIPEDCVVKAKHRFPLQERSAVVDSQHELEVASVAMQRLSPLASDEQKMRDLRRLSVFFGDPHASIRELPGSMKWFARGFSGLSSAEDRALEALSVALPYLFENMGATSSLCRYQNVPEATLSPGEFLRFLADASRFLGVRLPEWLKENGIPVSPNRLFEMAGLGEIAETTIETALRAGASKQNVRLQASKTILDLHYDSWGEFDEQYTDIPLTRSDFQPIRLVPESTPMAAGAVLAWKSSVLGEPALVVGGIGSPLNWLKYIESRADFLKELVNCLGKVADANKLTAGLYLGLLEGETPIFSDPGMTNLLYSMGQGDPLELSTSEQIETSPHLPPIETVRKLG